MEEFFNRIIRYFLKNVEKPLFLFFIPVLAITGIFLISKAEEIIGTKFFGEHFVFWYSFSIQKIHFLLFLSFLGLIFWLKRRQFPKFKNNKIGIFLLVESRHGNLNIIIDQFEKEFKSTLWVNENIEIKKVGDYHSQQILEAYKKYKNDASDYKSLTKIRAKTNATYIINFEFNKRNANKIKLETNQIVFHSKISKNNKELLRQDLTFIIPNNIVFNADEEMESLSYISQNLKPGITYIIAATKFLAGFFDDSLEMLKDIYDSNEVTAINPSYQKLLKDKITHVMAECFFEKGEIAISTQKNTSNYNEQVFNWALIYNDKWLHLSGNKYKFYLQRCMLYFLQSFNTLEPKNILNKAKYVAGSDQTWRLDLVFLYLWDWQNEDAINEIKKFKKHCLTRKACLSAIEFNEWIIQKFPDKKQLLFWSAVIAKKIAKDNKNFHKYKCLYLETTPERILKDFIDELST